MASGAVAVKAPVARSARGSYQFPAPPRPVWAYSCGGEAVVVVVVPGGAVEVGDWFASRSSASLFCVSSICDSVTMLPAPPRPQVGMLDRDRKRANFG